MSNRTVMPSDAEHLSALAATNLGNQANPNPTGWIDTRGFSWVDFFCEFDSASNATSLVATFEQASTLAEPSTAYPATVANVRSFAHESWDSGSSTFQQQAYVAVSPTLSAGDYADEGWVFTVPAHGRWVRMVVYGTNISSPSSSDVITVRAYRRS